MICTNIPSKSRYSKSATRVNPSPTCHSQKLKPLPPSPLVFGFPFQIENIKNPIYAFPKVPLMLKEKVMGSETFVEIILAILLPPLGVFLRYGCGV